MSDIGKGRTYPLDIADQLHAPVLGLYGEEDMSIPLETVEEMREKLKAANDPSEIIVYLPRREPRFPGRLTGLRFVSQGSGRGWVAADAGSGLSGTFNWCLTPIKKCHQLNGHHLYAWRETIGV